MKYTLTIAHHHTPKCIEVSEKSLALNLKYMLKVCDAPHTSIFYIPKPENTFSENTITIRKKTFFQENICDGVCFFICQNLTKKFPKIYSTDTFNKCNTKNKEAI